MEHILVLPDGSRIKSGPTENPAILKLSLTQSVNSQKELTLGSVCSQMLEATLYAPNGLNMEAGQWVELWERDEKLAGRFLLEKPVRKGASYQLTAYDAISLLDRDLTGWLASLTGWPYTLSEFTALVFTQCGLSFQTDEIPNGSFLIQKFAARQVTGRQLISWAAECAGRFCRIGAHGNPEFAWYTQGITVAPGRESFYYQGSLSREDYTVLPITGVQIRREARDVGTCYPQTQTGENTYIVEGNPFLCALDADTLVPVARTLYEQLQPVSYTPCSLTVPAALGIEAGEILAVQAGEEVLQVYVMKRVRKGGRDTLSCTGSPRRGTANARNQATMQALAGKVLHLQTDVDGIQAENRDAAGKLAKLAMDIDGISAQVSCQEETLDAVKSSVTNVEQSAKHIRLSVEGILQDGVSKVVTRKNYTFDDKGLNISGTSGMENRLDETGMEVTRNGSVLLKATSEGVVAADVQVNNYLIIGGHARLEDYTDGWGKRTACFYLEG